MMRLTFVAFAAFIVGCAGVKITEESAVYKKEWVKEKEEPPKQVESFSRKWHWESA